ncbi:hypothetical protein E6R60_26465 [Streptomyces sp. A0642]|uniref:hypothetical protein n=1 Tax=Streptomyces sp. A0642 TaxID=2563100 RepID=UPI0010A22604|nr:hypothetical protein [Streptomyces sp. A0642]THA72477.1 hypothetical protein E6R60_26465 [Streptomyces sp. A0642]
MRSHHTRRRPATAVIDDDGARHCAWCGDFIDPVNWCPDCTPDTPCATSGGPHRRLLRRADAAYYDSGCKAADRSDREGAAERRRTNWIQQAR